MTHNPSLRWSVCAPQDRAKLALPQFLSKVQTLGFDGHHLVRVIHVFRLLDWRGRRVPDTREGEDGEKGRRGGREG